MSKELNVKILDHPKIMESGVYDTVFEVDGEGVEREFEVGIIATYDHEYETNYSHLKSVVVTTVCCNEEDEDIADIMERKLEEAIEDYMYSE